MVPVGGVTSTTSPGGCALGGTMVVLSCSGGRSRKRRLDRTPGLRKPGSWLGCAMGATREARAS